MKKSSWLLPLALLAFSCENEQVESSFQEETTAETIIINNRSGSSSVRQFTPTGINCEETHVLDLYNGDVGVGDVEVGVNATSIDATFTIYDSEWFLMNIAIYAGDCDAIPDDLASYPYYAEFDLQTQTGSGSVAMQGLPDCGCLHLIATIGRYNPQSSEVESYLTEASTDYCNCNEPEDPEDPDDKNLRTQTPGGWGAPPRGNNPGAYLHANFDSAFPGGLIVGCDFTITLTSAQAITDYLPAGGTPSSLTANYVDPVKNPKNTLASHVIALTLSTTFDQWDADFGESNTNLANAIITSGDFEGWTVGAVLEEANNILGGCVSEYSASQLQDVISQINECFVDGTTNTGFLENNN